MREKLKPKIIIDRHTRTIGKLETELGVKDKEIEQLKEQLFILQSSISGLNKISEKIRGQEEKRLTKAEKTYADDWDMD